MNIWIFNHYAVSPDMPGGTRHYDFAKELIKRGHRVTIFASSFNYNLHQELKFNKDKKRKFENINGINFIWIKTFAYQKNNWRRIINMIFYSCRAYWAGRKMQKPDIIIGSSVHLLAVLTAYCLAKYHKARFIFEVRDLWPQTLVDMGKYKKNNLVIKILKCLEKFLYKKSEKIITLLPLAKNYISSLGVDSSKIIWIPNGVDLSKLLKNRLNNKYFKIIYLGAHGLANALNIILDTAKIIQNKNLKKIKFIFIGDGAEKKNLIKYKSQLQLKNVKFYKAVPKNMVSAILSQVDILLFNLKKTAVFKYGISSNKLFDYMAASKPIIFSANAVNNPVDEARCGISVQAENPQEMSKAIIRLYQMPFKTRNKMGARGRKYVEKYHSMPVLVNKLEKVLNETIS